MKIALCSIAYNDEPTIKKALQTFQKLNPDQHIVAISDTPYHGDPYPTDRTEEIVRSYNCQIIKGSWKEEHVHRNACLTLVDPDTDWVVWHESDMEITSKNLIYLERSLSVYDKKFEVIRAKQNSYWVTRDWIIEDDEYHPVIAHRPNVRFVRCAHTDAEMLSIYDPELTVEHFNWCEPKDILKKVKTYHHAPQIPKDWYEKHWFGWVPGDKLLMFNGQWMSVRKRKEGEGED